MNKAFLIGLALLLSGCSVRGYSPEQVRQIRKIDKELCDLRIATTLLSLKTVAPMANDEGMNLTTSHSR